MSSLSYIPGGRTLTLDNGVHGAALLAETAVDAFGHVNIITGGAATSILALLSLNGDRLGRADGLAELAGDASLLAGGVAAQGVFTTEAGGDGALFEGIEDGVPELN